MPDSRSEKKYPIVGGGAKKVLYTLSTVSRIGLLNSAKALSSHNTCKACGLGMGGQKGGMINELGEFPSVCNKSIQAQSTDIQPAIPLEVFKHSIADFKELSGREMETLGRLNTPLYKAKGATTYLPVDWDWALDYAARQFTQTSPERCFFYSSGRSSNEAGFVLQLLSRLYGTNNVNNCSYYCHQATGVGMANTIGTGTATIELEDLKGCDLIFIIGANPASNHPRFIHQLQAIRERGGQVVVINPAKEPGLVRFATPKSARSMLSGGSWIASEYIQPNIGSDLSLLTALAKALIEADQFDDTFIKEHTQGFEEFRQAVQESDWNDLCDATGIVRERIESIAQLYTQADHVVFAWGMGITHHCHGVENVEAIANLALLRGMVGKRYAGLLPLRGHSNVQGIGTIGVKPVLPKDIFNRLEQSLGIHLPERKGLDPLGCLTQSHAGDIDAALIMGGNLLEATPDTAWAEQAFNRIGFKVFLTTTLNRGHVRGVDKGDTVILPVAARDEEWQPTTQESMFNYVRMSDGGIQRLANPRPEVQILCDLALKMVPNAPVDFNAFKSHRTIRKAIAKVVPGMEALADIDVAKKEFHIHGRLLHTPDFKTPNGKARFVAHSIQKKSVNKDYPFQLMSVRSEGQFNTIIYEDKDSYRGTDQRWVVMMGEDDMKQLQLSAGDNVDICSPQGKMKSVSVHPFDLPPGNLMAYFPEANVLIGRETDPRSKTPAFKSVAVAVSVSE